MQKAYCDVNSMWHNALCDLFDYGDRVASVRKGTDDMASEVIGWSGKLLDPSKNFLTNAPRAASPAYAAAELLWYLSRSDSVEMLLPYAPSYKRFAEPDGRAYGSYGKRIKHNIEVGMDYIDQLDYTINKLKSEGGTRQCVVTLWRPDDLIAVGKKDIPCTLTWQFLVRRGALHMVVNMRSNDVWLGMPYDIFCFTSIQMLVADTLKLSLGTYTHNAGSLHMYERDRCGCGDAMLSRSAGLGHGWEGIDELGEESHYLALETMARGGYGDEEYFEQQIGSSLLSDMVRCCVKHHGLLDIAPQSPALLKGFQNVDSRRSRLGRQNDAVPGSGQVS